MIQPARDLGIASHSPRIGPLDRSRAWRIRLGWRVALGLLAVVVVVLGCQAEQRPASVLFISIDTLRADHLSSYGYPRSTTPVLDAIAEQGALFEQAVSTSNWTLPAHVSMFTGLFPPSHQVEEQHDRLADSIQTVTEVFRQAGHSTAGVTSHVYLDVRYGFARGFEDYDTTLDQSAEAVTDKAIAWLEGHEQDSFFLFAHYFDPHWDYAPPAPFVSRFGSPNPEHGTLAFLLKYYSPFSSERIPDDVRQGAIDLYDGEIAYTDSQLGRLFDWLSRNGRLDDTIVVVVSDHGEELGDHRGFGHGTHMHGEVTRVPMIMRYPPRIDGGTRRHDLVTLADLPATLISLAELADDPQFSSEGVDLFADPSKAKIDSRVVIAESTRMGQRRFSVQKGRDKFLSRGEFAFVAPSREKAPAPKPQPKKLAAVPGFPVPPSLEATLGERLYDLSVDPGEHRNRLDLAVGRQVLNTARSLLGLHIASSSRGVTLRCSSGDAKDPSYSGTIEFDSPLIDEPYPASFGDTARVETADMASFRLSLRPAEGEAAIVFPTGEEHQRMQIAIHRDGESIFAGSLSMPAPGESRSLGQSDGRVAACSVMHAVRVYGSQTGVVDLSEQELQELRALGYAE